eukprot:7564003-Lingulodinium_polyedra.AAC.1
MATLRAEQPQTSTLCALLLATKGPRAHEDLPERAEEGEAAPPAVTVFSDGNAVAPRAWEYG